VTGIRIVHVPYRGEAPVLRSKCIAKWINKCDWMDRGGTAMFGKQ
jgi:hypothetical protein